jgi:hypothetical protein
VACCTGRVAFCCGTSFRAFVATRRALALGCAVEAPFVLLAVVAWVLLRRRIARFGLGRLALLTGRLVGRRTLVFRAIFVFLTLRRAFSLPRLATSCSLRKA